MRALVCKGLGEDFSRLSLEDVSPEPVAPEMVRVRLEAAALNFPDLLMLKGGYQFKPELPFIPGMEGAGRVSEVGTEVTHLAPGNRVIVSGKTGAFAEEILAPATAVRPIPGDLTMAEAAGLTAAYLTAYVSLVPRGGLEAGEVLLVHGAAGGVGLAAVDLGLALGARVIATAGSTEKRAFLKERGAALVLPAEEFRTAVKAATGGAGADVIYDPVGGEVFRQSLRCIAWGGRLLVVGFASGIIPEVPANIPLIKGFSVVGVRAGEFGRRDPAAGKAALEAVDRLAGEGRIRPHVGEILPLSRAVEAFERLAARQVIGRLIIDCTA